MCQAGSAGGGGGRVEYRQDFYVNKLWKEMKHFLKLVIIELSYGDYKSFR